MHLTACNINMNVPVKINLVNVLSFTAYTKIKELSMTTHDKPQSPKNELVNWMDSRLGEGGPEQIKIKEVFIYFHRQWPVQEVRIVQSLIMISLGIFLLTYISSISNCR